jgi:hypothetical protein
MSNWLSDREHILHELWQAGVKTEDIATRMGAKSKNAVVGAIGRLREREGRAKWPQRQVGRISSRQMPSISDTAVSPSVSAIPAPPVVPAPRLPMPIYPSIPDDSTVEYRPWKSLIDMPANACRYPMPDGTWCGCLTTLIAFRGIHVPSSYCAKHYRMCHEKSKRAPAIA